MSMLKFGTIVTFFLHATSLTFIEGKLSLLSSLKSLGIGLSVWALFCPMDFTSNILAPLFWLPDPKSNNV